MEAISCLVPELQSKTRSGCRTQLLKKNANFNVFLCYSEFAHFLVKKQLESQRRQLGKTAVIKAGAYICVYGQKDNRIPTEAGKIACFF